MHRCSCRSWSSLPIRDHGRFLGDAGFRMRAVRLPWLITLVVVAFAAFARTAAAAPCEGDANELRVDLQREARRTRQWNWAWRIVHTTGAVAQLGIAASGKANHDDTQSLWVGGAKSTL